MFIVWSRSVLFVVMVFGLLFVMLVDLDRLSDVLIVRLCLVRVFFVVVILKENGFISGNLMRLNFVCFVFFIVSWMLLVLKFLV